MGTVLVVDAANVVGQSPAGWQRDRAAAAQNLHEGLLLADVPHDIVVLVLEGQAKAGVKPGRDAHVRIVHAPKDGDATIIAEARKDAEKGNRVTVVTADRALAANVAGFADTLPPSWLLNFL